MEYQDAFADFAEIYLEDSWVLDVAATEHGVSFRLDAVLTSDHPGITRPHQVSSTATDERRSR